MTRSKNSIECARVPHVQKPGCAFLTGDVRDVLPHFTTASVDCIITSPPYADVKDYGTLGQIGYGQKTCEAYLEDLGMVFRQLYRVAKPGAAFWLVIDRLKGSAQKSFLPLDLATQARAGGWVFHDLIVWDKGRSLPWSNVGHFRRVCELILLFGKGNLTHFSLTAARDYEDLSPYWLRYPERYHPGGKAPPDLWHFPIPVQGSWSNGKIRHFCPLPLNLVARMICISTKETSTVLDPFCGTGSVMVVASHMRRNGLGIDINQQFAKEFDFNGYGELMRRARNEIGVRAQTHSSLAKHILTLRMLKYPKSLFRELMRPDRLGKKARVCISFFLIRSVAKRVLGTEGRLKGLGEMHLCVLGAKGANVPVLRREVKMCEAVPPLSKFGIVTKTDVIPYETWRRNRFLQSLKHDHWFLYKNGRFYKFHRKVRKGALHSALEAELASSVPTLIAPLKVALEIPSGQ